MDEKLKPLLTGENAVELKKVTKYLTNNPMASVMEISRDTEVQPGLLSRFVDAGIFRLSPRKNIMKRPTG